jgi:hypothetical protein
MSLDEEQLCRHSALHHPYRAMASARRMNAAAIDRRKRELSLIVEGRLVKQLSRRS